MLVKFSVRGELQGGTPHPFLKELKMEANLRPEEQVVVVSQAQRDREIIQVEGGACVNIGPLESIVLLSGNGSTGWGRRSGRQKR